jgi:hypothetical protein
VLPVEPTIERLKWHAADSVPVSNQIVLIGNARINLEIAATRNHDLGFSRGSRVAMYHYQVRITDDRQRPFLIWFAPASTYRALSRLRQLAEDGHTVEVWRNDECVHREKMGAEVPRGKIGAETTWARRKSDAR